MIWLTWRQFRLNAASAAVVLAAFSVLLAVTGPHLATLYAGSRIGSCHGGGCGGPADDFLQQLYGNSLTGASSVDGTGAYWLLYLLAILVILGTPAVIGIFWGAPLISSEFEARTHYLVWNQSITRTRWLAVKFALTGLAAIGFTEALSLLYGWWAAPISRAVARGAVTTPLAMNQFSPLVFASHGITPLGYAAFAFALGVTAGVLIRRAIPAMALTLSVFVLLQVAVPLWARPHLFPPERSLTSLSAFADLPDVSVENGSFTVITDGWTREPEGWVLSSETVDLAGQPISSIPAACTRAAQLTGGKGESAGLLNCLSSHGVRIAVTYQPASRYWAFQWTETAIYGALALALAGYCFWRIVRRRFSP
ncbi:MAG TPA: hypothetical protein VIA06_25670 [Candidatus Dormibacteraeota bacterium]|nr:hypothetical protein [Candidatus Dormibacteraeota bacterium]